MVLRSKWCAVIFTTFCSNYYFTFAADDQEIKFTMVKAEETNKLLCVGEPLEVTVNDEFRISLDPGGNYIHRQGRCHSYLSHTPDLIYTHFKLRDDTILVSDEQVTAHVRGDWEYECIFYTHKCEYIQENECKYYYNSWSLSSNTDEGVLCTAKVHVKNSFSERPTPVKPLGYLTANGVNLTSSSEEYSYKFRDGENTEFACHKMYGGFVSLLFTAKDVQNSTALVWASPVRMNLELTAASNDSTLECIITSYIENVTYTLTVRFIIAVDENTKGSTNWIVVVCGVLSVVLLAAVGFGIIFSLMRRKRLRKKNSSSVQFQNSSEHRISINRITVSLSQRDQPDDCTYAEPYSFGNTYAKLPTAQTQHTYLNTLELTYASVLNESTYAPTQNNEPTYASAVNCEPNYAEVHNVEPKFAAVKNSGLHFAMQDTVQKSKDKTVSQKPDPTNHNSIEYHNIDSSKLKYLQGDKNKKSSDVPKSRKKTRRQEKGPKRKIVEKPKSNDVTYAELCLKNTKPGNFVAPEVPAYSDIRDLRSQNQEYENAFVKDEIEPAYSEIIPKTK